MGKPYQDLTGQRFGLLVAVEQRAAHDGGIAWLFRCDCGGSRVAKVGALRWGVNHGSTPTCGCRPELNITGQRFGRLVAIKKVSGFREKTTWRCRCDCNVETLVAKSNLLNGHTQSCGCLRLEKSVEAATRHGATSGPRSEWSREHAIWCGMISRCTNPKVKNFHRYGGRGIRVCARWLGEEGFVNFLADMGPRPSKRHSIERKNTDGHYEPDNCCWATPVAQCNNTSRNRKITAFGRTLTAAEWARETGIAGNTIRRRLDRGGMSPEEAVSQPLATGNQTKAWATRRARAQRPAAL